MIDQIIEFNKTFVAQKGYEKIVAIYELGVQKIMGWRTRTADPAILVSNHQGCGDT